MKRIIFFAIFPGLLHAAELRSWTDVQGRRIEARMAGLDGESVLLELKDGRKVPYPLAKLSAADADYARSEAAKAPEEKSGADGDKAAGFDSPWPDRIRFTEDPEINVVKEDAENKQFIYESANYRYVCDVRLAKSVVKGFAIMFEATHQFCRSLPLKIDGGEKRDGKLQIRLFEKFDDYVAAGGPPESAGVFIGGSSEVLVPLDSLGVRPVGSGYMLDRDKSSKTLPHELTHQLTPVAYFRTAAMGWFSEGLAEYVAVTPYRSGTYNVRNNHRDIVEYVTGYGKKGNGGRGLGENISLPPLKAFMLQDYDRFLENAQVNYGVALLLTYYFMQMDGEEDAARLKEFLQALRKGKDREEALGVLLGGRSFEQLEKDVAKAWSRRGVDLTFAAAP